MTRFNATFDIEGLYVWHCHIVEHEDNEMMVPFCVGDRNANGCQVAGVSPVGHPVKTAAREIGPKATGLGRLRAAFFGCSFAFGSILRHELRPSAPLPLRSPGLRKGGSAEPPRAVTGLACPHERVHTEEDRRLMRNTLITTALFAAPIALAVAGEPLNIRGRDDPHQLQPGLPDRRGLQAPGCGDECRCSGRGHP